MYSWCSRARDAIRSSLPFRFSLSPLCRFCITRLLYLQSRLSRKRLLLKKRRFKQRKTRENCRSFANTSLFSLLFRAQMIFHTVRFHSSTISSFSQQKTFVFATTHNSPATFAFASGHRRMTSYVSADYMFPLINIACALCANEDDAAAAFPRKSARGICTRDLRRYTCTVRRAYVDRFGTFLPSYVHLIVASSNAPLARTRFASRFAAAPHCNAPPGGLFSIRGFAATPSIRASLPAIGSNQFQQRRQRRRRWRRPCDNGSLTCPHLPFSRSRTASKKEKRRLLWCIQR